MLRRLAAAVDMAAPWPGTCCSTKCGRPAPTVHASRASKMIAVEGRGLTMKMADTFCSAMRDADASWYESHAAALLPAGSSSKGHNRTLSGLPGLSHSPAQVSTLPTRSRRNAALNREGCRDERGQLIWPTDEQQNAQARLWRAVDCGLCSILHASRGAGALLVP